MLRNIGAVAVGVITGAIVAYFVEKLGGYVTSAPGGSGFVALLSSWFAGIFAGGLAALRIGRNWAPAAWVVAATLFAMALITMFQIPHPLWMMAGAVVATLAGGFGSIKLMGGTYTRPGAPISSGP